MIYCNGILCLLGSYHVCVVMKVYVTHLSAPVLLQETIYVLDRPCLR